MLIHSAILLVELAILFFGVAFAVELSQRRLGPERLRAWMGGRPTVAALKGIFVGFVTPFCTFSALPLLVGLRKAGVTPAGYVAFIVAAPVLDPVLFGALVVIVGIKAAVTYGLVAFTAAMTLALVAERVDISRHLHPVAVGIGPANPSPTITAPTDPESCTGAEDSPPWRGARVETNKALIAAIDLLRTMGPLLLVGVAVGLAIEALVPPGAIAEITGDQTTFAIPVAAILGTPLYFSTELFIPIAESLRGAGVGIGAIVALTIAGAGANVPEFILLSRLAESRLIAIFVGYVFTVAVVGGTLAELLAG